MGEDTAMTYCDQLRLTIESSIGSILSQIGASFKFTEEDDGCRIYYWSPLRDICIYQSFQNGDLNCFIADKNVEVADPSTRWVPIWEVVGYGQNMTEAELEALVPETIPSTEQMLREVGEMLLKLKQDSTGSA